MPGVPRFLMSDRVHVAAHEGGHPHALRTLRQAARALLTVEAGELGLFSLAEILLFRRRRRQVAHDREVPFQFVVVRERRDGRVDVLVPEHSLQCGLHVDLAPLRRVPVHAGLRLHGEDTKPGPGGPADGRLH